MGDGRRLPFTQTARFRKLADQTKTAEWRRNERERERERGIHGRSRLYRCKSLRKFT